MIRDQGVRRAAGLMAMSLCILAGGLSSSVPSTNPTWTDTRAPSSTSHQVLIPVGAVWKYLDDGSDQGVGWRTIGFDDGGWPSGAAQLGYGDGDEATVVAFGPDPNDKFITTYFRRVYTVKSAERFDGLSLRLLRDDGAVVYLNGVEVFRSNMPAGSIVYTTTAATSIGGADESSFVTAFLSPSLLVAGPNILAVEVHQANGASSDISFDLELVGTAISGGCTSPDVRIAVIGDFGISGQPERDVSSLVSSWDPDFVATVGDNNYPIGSATTIDQNIGQYYHAFIGNYTGNYGPGVASNRFYPALGNHDWDIVNTTVFTLPQPYLDYFALPGNERYYSVVLGPVELFVVDSDPREPDGRTSVSAQAAWLHDGLAASTVPWKLVALHHPPYSSSSMHGSETQMQWPYKAWGVSAVLAGHDHAYERIIVDSLPYFVNGLGGNGIYDFGTPISGSVARYNGDYGAMLVKADDLCLSFQMVTRTGWVVDTYILSLYPYDTFLPIVLEL